MISVDWSPLIQCEFESAKLKSSVMNLFTCDKTALSRYLERVAKMGNKLDGPSPLGASIRGNEESRPLFPHSIKTSRAKFSLQLSCQFGKLGTFLARSTASRV